MKTNSKLASKLSRESSGYMYIYTHIKQKRTEHLMFRNSPQYFGFVFWVMFFSIVYIIWVFLGGLLVFFVQTKSQDLKANPGY